MIQIELPYPPSVNTYWRHPNKGPLAGRHLISEKGRAYRNAVIACVLKYKDARNLAGEAFQGEVELEIVANPPDRRRRDLDNILKSLLDSLVHASLLQDDSQISRLTISRGEVRPPGYIFVTIFSKEQ